MSQSIGIPSHLSLPPFGYPALNLFMTNTLLGKNKAQRQDPQNEERDMEKNKERDRKHGKGLFL